MKYGYARVSTKGQAKDGNNLEHQERALRDAGAETIYMDAFTGTKSHRRQERSPVVYYEKQMRLLIIKYYVRQERLFIIMYESRFRAI